jgi:hypothetical protein
MASKSRGELTAEAVLAAIERGRPRNMTGLAHGLGYAGSVGSSLTKKLRSLVPGIDSLFLKQGVAGKAAGGEPEADGKAVAKKAVKPPTKATVANPIGKAVPPHHPANPYRAGLYATLFDCMATPTALRDGISRERWKSPRSC